MDNGKQKIIAVVGPTASGKTELSLTLAWRLDGEIVSADSRQVYRGMDIGSNKITKKERGDIPHHLLDVTTPDTQFTVADYVRAARAAIRDIASRGKFPIVCGGTMFYLDALLGNRYIPPVPPLPRVRETLEKKTVDELYAELKRHDPRRAAAIDPKNKRRIIRALEIIRATGKPVPLARRSLGEGGLLYNITFVAPYRTREELKQRITERVYKRWEGIVAETKKLRTRYKLSWERLDSFGLEYRYATRFICGELTEKEAQERLIAATWRYAKKQLAWCAKRPVRYLPPE